MQLPPPPASSSQLNQTTGVCICCDNLLRFPIGITCFRCTVCDCINDLKPIHTRTAQPLSLPLLDALVTNSLVDPLAFDELIGHLKYTFSNYDSLNNSFIKDDATVQLKDPGVNLLDVRAAWHLILKRGKEVEKIVMQSLDKLLKRVGRRLLNPEDIIFLIIILESPLFFSIDPSTDRDFYHDILARTFGLLSCLANELHHYVVSWFVELSLPMFQRRVDLVNQFITYRLTKKEGMREQYAHDWGIRSAARIMALLFAANQERIEKIAISDFYNTVVDYFDMIKDYMRWQEERSGSFSLCQYPFLISLGKKMQIMEADAKRQMAERFKEAFFRTAIHGLVTDPFLSLFVHRNTIIQDSLTQLSSPHIDLKKRLRIEFLNEDGVDAGGLTKEWFLLLVRELFDPQYGMFMVDEESGYTWFCSTSLETTEEFRLVGTIIGLAIYNSMILDIHFPLLTYKKLLNQPVTIHDLQSLKPSLANGLMKLLEYDGEDVEEVFGLEFVVEYESFGEIKRDQLVENGASIPVTSLNKRQYVDAYVDWVVNASVRRQFDAFRDGFNHVCGGNALSLFRAEEIEMMVRGSKELDLKNLESVTEYDGFDPGEETVIRFWEILDEYSEEMKKKTLMFITGTDRIPATGIQNMAFKISCLGEDSDKLPISHTCFNQLCLYRYSSKEKMRLKLTMAVDWSAGFGMK